MMTTRPAIWTYYHPSPFVRPMAAAARHKWTKNLGRQERREGLAVTINISHSSFSPPGELETGKKDRSFRPPRPVFSPLRGLQSNQHQTREKGLQRNFLQKVLLKQS